jgi:hypothetical protein
MGQVTWITWLSLAGTCDHAMEFLNGHKITDKVIPELEPEELLSRIES